MTKELHSIQYLRGLAALLVVLIHVPVQLKRMGYAGYWPDALNMGVDIFFVISGFIMWTTTASGQMTPVQFMQRRLARIAPLYWLLTAFSALLLAVPSLQQSGQFNAAHVLQSFLFVASEHPVTHAMQPLLVPGWTLNLEMFFYLVFALCLPLTWRWRAATVIAALTAITACHGLFPEGPTLEAFYSSGIILEFVYGIGLGVVFTHGRRILVYGRPAVLAAAALAAVALAAVLINSDLPRAIAYGVPALLLVAVSLSIELRFGVRRIGMLHAIGDASYSLYLTHGIVLSALGQVWRKSGAEQLPFGFTLFTIYGVLVVMGAGSTVYHWVERPLHLACCGIGRGKPVLTTLRPAYAA